MNIKQGLALILCAQLCACNTTVSPNPPIEGADASLAEASYSVSRSIVSLSESAQASHPVPRLQPIPSPASYGMAELTSIDWSGPVEPLVIQVARAANYRTRVLGTAPAIPVIITLNDKNRMLADVLADIGYQCGRRASVVVYPESRVVELRYAKN